jgi:glucosylceramidase
MAKMVLTTLDGSKLLEEQPLNFDAVPEAIAIDLDTSKTFQVMDGFGFTLTGGSAKLLQGMTNSARTDLLQELFGRDSNAIGISYLRVSIGASDLDEKTWSYDDRPKGETDVLLDHFSLGYDTLYLIPTLQEIRKIAPEIKIMGSPWSPPAWMKDNEDTRGGSLKPEYFGVYAHYLVRYLLEMKKQGIPIEALTVQNEPLHPGNNPSLLMLAEQQADFIAHHLGPAFVPNNIKTKIIIYDHNADRPDYPIAILNDPEAARYIDGSAFHLYGGTIDALSEVHTAFPEKNIYFTEQWIGAPGNFATDFTWHIENLVIGAPNNWAKTVLEWNLAADENQEPHTDRGGCIGCLGALTIIGDRIVRNPAYYIIAQTSKFVPPGSVRIGSTEVPTIPNVAYRTPIGNLVVILQNKEASDKKVVVGLGQKKFSLKLPKGAVATVVLP